MAVNVIVKIMIFYLNIEKFGYLIGINEILSIVIYIFKKKHSSNYLILLYITNYFFILLKYQSSPPL